MLPAYDFPFVQAKGCCKLPESKSWKDFSFNPKKPLLPVVLLPQKYTWCGFFSQMLRLELWGALQHALGHGATSPS